LVRDGKASAMMSAGNTGATMAAALLRMGRIKGVHRPAIATALPKLGSAPTIMLDGGANTEVQPSWLVQFAQMGSAYAASRFGLESPRVALLTIGEEAGKGNDLTKQTFKLLQDAPGIQFIGNAEGRDLLTDQVDVVVTDGFTGNVCLKALEGCLRFMVSNTIRTVNESGADQQTLQKNVVPALESMFEALSPDTYGGAMLLGTDGVCVISHGSSSPRAIVTALCLTAELVERDLVGHLRAAIGMASPAHDA
jgi:glycerol-3-phosphate acyltransferase PlsX